MGFLYFFLYPFTILKFRAVPGGGVCAERDATQRGSCEQI